MKLLKPILTLALGCLLPVAAHASAICPTTGSTNSDCGYIITIGAGGAVSGAAVPGADPYDGSDDALIGVINNSGAIYNGSFTLSGSTPDGGLFEFDGDGICKYTGASYCSSAPTGYEGPKNTFSNITGVGDSTGTVNITGLGAAMGSNTTYFSLEGSPANFGNITVGGAAPEPSSLMLLGTGVLGLAGTLRRRLVK